MFFGHCKVKEFEVNKQIALNGQSLSIQLSLKSDFIVLLFLHNTTFNVVKQFVTFCTSQMQHVERKNDGMNFLFLDTFHPVLGSTHILAPCSGHSCLLGLSVSVYFASHVYIASKGIPLLCKLFESKVFLYRALISVCMFIQSL